MEYFPEDVLRVMQSCENALRESVSAGQLVHYRELATILTAVRNTLFGDCEESPSGFHIKDMTYSEWFCRIVDLLDLSCEGTEVKTTSVELSSLFEASFELNSKDAQAVHWVANLLFFKCFLFWCRVEGNPIFAEKISTMFKKWNQDSSCESILARWKECDVEISELTKKMLFEWTHSALEDIGRTCENRMGKWQLRGNYVEAASLGDKYIDFLGEYNRCLDPDETSDIEFLYTEIYVSCICTAKLHFRLGKYVQAQELCDKLLRLFDKLEEFVDEMKIPIRREGKTVYIQPSVRSILGRKHETLTIMIDSLRAQNKSAAAYVDQRSRNVSKVEGPVMYFPEDRPHPYGSQLIDMAELILAERYFFSPTLLRRNALSFPPIKLDQALCSGEAFRYSCRYSRCRANSTLLMMHLAIGAGTVKLKRHLNAIKKRLHMKHHCVRIPWMCDYLLCDIGWSSIIWECPVNN